MTHAAQAMVGRDRNELQVRITFSSPEEAKAALEKIIEELRTTGRSNIPLYGTVEDLALGEGRALL